MFWLAGLGLLVGVNQMSTIASKQVGDVHLATVINGVVRFRVKLIGSNRPFPSGNKWLSLKQVDQAIKGKVFYALYQKKQLSDVMPSLLGSSYN